MGQNLQQRLCLIMVDFNKFQLMRIKLREYKTTDYEQLEQLFYNTVHSVNAKDYTKE